MRLLKFLNEESNITEDLNGAIQVIVKNCQPFLKERVVLYKGAFLHGSEPSTGVRLIKYGMPINRSPKATDFGLYGFINKWLENNGYVRRDKSVICTGNKKVASGFGFPFMIFPIGDFKFTWCKSEDFNIKRPVDDFNIDFFSLIYNSLPTTKWSDSVTMTISKQDVPPEKLLKDTLGSTNIQLAVKNGWELWLSAIAYYSLYIKSGREFSKISQQIQNGKLGK